MKKKRKNKKIPPKISAVKKNVTELSDLPEDIMIHIFSFMNTRFAVKTCLMFKQWNHLWTKLPTLNFHIYDLQFNYHYTDFFTNILIRNDLCTLQGFNFDFDWFDMYMYMSRITDGIDFRCVEQIGIERVSFDFSFSLSRCRCLKVLKLKNCTSDEPERLDIPTLKTLHLNDVHFSLSDGTCGFSLSCTNLEELVLHKVTIDPSKFEFMLSCPNLLSLSISKMCFNIFIIKISAPKLAYFNYSSRVTRVLSVEDDFPWQLQTVKLDIYPPFERYPWDRHDFSNIMNTFKLLSNAYSLTLTSKTVEALSMFRSLLKKGDFPFNNLGSLKLGVKNLKSPKVKADERIGSFNPIPEKVMNFLCRGGANKEILDFKYEY